MAKQGRYSPDPHHDDEDLCGWGPFHPRWLQKFHNSTCLVLCLMLPNITHGVLMSGFVPASVSAWTKRFGLKNQEVATLQTCFEVASIMGLILLSHWGNIGSKPRWIGAGAIIYSVGAFLYVIPQWASPAYDFAGAASAGGGSTGGDYCIIRSDNVTCPNTGEMSSKAEETATMEEPKSGGGGNLAKWFYLFCFASLLRGFGSSPSFVLGPTYLDENVSQKKSPRLLGLMMAASGIGPLAGAALASVCLKIYGDIGKISSSELDVVLDQINPADPRWYGAWWIGFLGVGLTGFVGIPILGFARKLPKAAEERKNDVSQTFKVQASTAAAKSIREVPLAIFNLCRNYVFLLVCLGQVFMTMTVAGVMLFGPRLMEDLFAVSGSTAILIFGSAGMALGGLIIGKLKLKAKGMLRYCAVCSFLSTPLLAIYLLHCDPLPIAGVITIDYDGKPLTSGAPKVLMNACNRNCSCQSSGFQPVCDVATGVSYYSPCHAGCIDEIRNKMNPLIPARKWDNCSCVDHSEEFMATLFPDDPEKRNKFIMKQQEKIVEQGLDPNKDMVVTGMCTRSCWKFGVFIGLLVVKGTLLGLRVPAMQQCQLRTVGIEQRTMSLSFVWLMSRLLGIIPGQQIMGSIVDSACEFAGEKPPEPSPGQTSLGPDGCPMSQGIIRKLRHHFETSSIQVFVEKGRR